MKKNILLLINPHSGTGRGMAAAEFLEQNLPNNTWTIEKAVSPNQYYFINFLANKDLSVYDALVVVGGDGTMHEVINGLAQNKGKIPPVQLFPCGSGNALNHDLACLDFETALQNLLRMKTQKIDIMSLKTKDEDLFSFNIVGWGLVSDINVTSEKLRWLGTARYTLGSLVDIFRNPKFKARVEVDDEVFEGDFCFVLACNTQHTGKAMRMAPLADLSDGLVDVVIVKHVPVYKLLPLFPKVFAGTHIDAPILTYKKAKRFSITTDNDILNIDGETKCQTPVSVEVMPQWLEMIV